MTLTNRTKNKLVNVGALALDTLLMYLFYRWNGYWHVALYAYLRIIQQYIWPMKEIF